MIGWDMPKLASSTEKYQSELMFFGTTFSKCGIMAGEYGMVKGTTTRMEVGISLSQPFEVPFVQVFLGGLIRDRSVALDGNVFVAEDFENVTFRYGGQPFYFADNTVNMCTLEIIGDAPIPSVLARSNCAVRRVNQQGSTEGVLGSPLTAKSVDCTGHTPAECKHIELPFGPPFQLSNDCGDKLPTNQVLPPATIGFR